MHTYQTNEIDFHKVHCTELQRFGHQQTAFIQYEKYNDETKSMRVFIPLMVQSGPMIITSYGIPKLHPCYTQTDNQREYIQIPFDPNQPSCAALKEHLMAADQYFNSTEFKQKLFGANMDCYVYQPCVRSKAKYDNEDDGPQKPYYRDYPDYCKIKFEMKLVDGNRTPTTIIKRTNQTSEERLPVKTITEITDYIKFRSTIQFTFRYNRIWVNQNPAPRSKYLYGVNLGMVEIKIGRPYVDLPEPIYDLQELKRIYQTYMAEKRKLVQQRLIIEV